MTGWQTIDQGDAVHVLPVGGEDSHEPYGCCWCRPKVEAASRASRAVVVHNDPGEKDEKASEGKA